MTPSKLNQKIKDFGGSHLLNLYDHPYYLFSTFYPELQLKPWKFNKVPERFWEDFNNHKIFMEWVGKKLGIKEMKDWYKIGTTVQKNIIFGFLNFSGIVKYWSRIAVTKI